MNKKTILTLISSLVLLGAATPALASEISGTVTTGVSTGISGIVDAVPTATPPAGTYTSAQSVTLAADASDSIHYNIDDGTSALTCSTGTVYTGAIAVASSETIRAVACYSGIASGVGTFAYGINIAAPSGGGGSSGGGGGGGGGSGGSGGGGGGSTSIVGDLNSDGHVDLLDFNELFSAWGSTGSLLAADLNHDGVVDLLDFNILMANWTG